MSSTLLTNSTPGVSPVLGSTLPRLWTPPLVVGTPGPCGCGCGLTEATSDGFDVAWFAEHVVGTPLDLWERWAVIHGLELLPDGRPRFRKLLIIVARQNGKTLLCRILTLYWLFVLKTPLVLSTANNRGLAKVQWEKVRGMADKNPWLAPSLAKVRLQIGEEVIETADGSEYRFAAPNSDAGRSLSVSRLLIDELRTHKNYECWNAATYAMNAMPYGQAVCITNQGDDNSVVLNEQREAALAYIATGEGDPRLGILEWSAPEGSDPTDIRALAMANPNLGRHHANGDLALDPDVVLGDAATALTAGGDALTGFLTEVLCVRVRKMNPAIEPAAWGRCLDPTALGDAKRRVFCVDVSKDGMHATVYGASVMDDGRVRVNFVKEWQGLDCTNKMRQELPGLVSDHKPQKVGWLSGGPAAAMAADWSGDGKFAEIKSDLPAVCMGFAETVTSQRLAHSDDPLLNKQVETAEKYQRGDVWVFSRKGGPCDALYAAAGAVHLARTLPPPVGKPRLVTVT